MAVFLINICKFNGCGIKFDSLRELITHIETIHIGKCARWTLNMIIYQYICLPIGQLQFCDRNSIDFFDNRCVCVGCRVLWYDGMCVNEYAGSVFVL